MVAGAGEAVAVALLSPEPMSAAIVVETVVDIAEETAGAVEEMAEEVVEAAVVVAEATEVVGVRAIELHIEACLVVRIEGNGSCFLAIPGRC